MTAAIDGEGKMVLASEVDHSDDVVGVGAAGDDGGTAVDRPLKTRRASS
jgi:hypothetical protein